MIDNTGAVSFVVKQLDKNRSVHVYDNGRILVYYKNGVKHRDYGPAISHLNGYREWWKKGKFIKVEYTEE